MLMVPIIVEYVKVVEIIEKSQVEATEVYDDVEDNKGANRVLNSWTSLSCWSNLGCSN